jgi:hypothetical protein
MISQEDMHTIVLPMRRGFGIGSNIPNPPS